jgi:hypothetical protein
MKKIGLLLLALVVALGGLGVGYALWYKVLYVNGTVYTGEVNAIFVEAFTDDDGSIDDVDKDADDDGGPGAGPWYDAHGSASSEDPSSAGPNPTRYDKDVGKSTVVIDTDPQVLLVTLDDVYPSYWTTIWFDIKNNGSVPVMINELKITPDNFTLASAADADDGEIWIDWSELYVGLQLDPYEWDNELYQGNLEIHIEQCALENDDPAYPEGGYTFSAEIVLVQWNEYPYTPPYP